MEKNINHISGNRKYLIAYDFSSDRLRRKVEKTLSDYGSRLQKSLFSFDLSKSTIDLLLNKLKNILEKYKSAIASNDSLIIIKDGGYDELKRDIIEKNYLII